MTESLNGLGANYGKSVSGLLGMLEKFSHHGPSMLNSDICHEADSANKIFEFIKGDLRLLWFYGHANKIIICSHVFVKKGRKTPTNEKSSAISIRNDYFKQIDSGKRVDLFFESEQE